MGKRIAVLGAGAVGGYVGGYLSGAGHDVTLIDFWHDNVQAISANGLELSGPEGVHLVHPKILPIGNVSSLIRSDPIDIAFIIVKSYDTEWMATMIKPYLAEDGIVVSLQNCINEGTIAGVVGSNRTLGCIASEISVELFAPGRIRRQNARMIDGVYVFRVGELDGAMTARVAEVAALLGDVERTRITDNLWGERWTKLVSNAMNSGIAATTGLGSKQALADPKLRRLMIDLGVETFRVGTALGHRLLDVRRVPSTLYAEAGAGDEAALAELDRRFAALADPRPPLRLSSMGQDIQKGRRTEIDSLNGFIAARAREVGLPAPANEAVVAIVNRIQRGQLQPKPETVTELLVS